MELWVERDLSACHHDGSMIARMVIPRKPDCVIDLEASVALLQVSAEEFESTSGGGRSRTAERF
jgi:hypothetical protein